LDDELIENLVHRNNFKNNVGEKYKGLVIDSTACLHYGSRLISGQRKLLQLYLLTMKKSILKTSLRKLKNMFLK
jgi:hypothetical protein